MPMASSFKRFSRHGQPAIHSGISCGDVGCKENQRDVARAHASTGRNDKVFERPHLITDVEGLQETVCECYGTVKSYYQALLGPQAA
jgi:hypothetical protein